MSNNELLIFRRQQIDDYHNSGLSAVVWCETNSVKLSTLRYWLRRLKEIDQPVRELAWATMKRVEKTTANRSTPVIIRVNDFEISLHQGFEPAVLSAVIKTLQGI